MFFFSPKVWTLAIVWAEIDGRTLDSAQCEAALTVILRRWNDRRHVRISPPNFRLESEGFCLQNFCFTVFEIVYLVIDCLRPKIVCSGLLCSVVTVPGFGFNVRDCVKVSRLRLCASFCVQSSAAFEVSGWLGLRLSTWFALCVVWVPGLGFKV